MNRYEGGTTGASLAGDARRKVSKHQTAQRDAVELERFAARVKIGLQSAQGKILNR
jgi:hypothetical protein